MEAVDAKVIDLDGQSHNFNDIDRVWFINNESYGPGDKIGDIKAGADESILVVNVNGIACVQFDT